MLQAQINPPVEAMAQASQYIPEKAQARQEVRHGSPERTPEEPRPAFGMSMLAIMARGMKEMAEAQEAETLLQETGAAFSVPPAYTARASNTANVPRSVS